MSLKESRWPIGLGVWVAKDGGWHHGIIEARPRRGLASVRLDSGELYDVGFNYGHITPNNPLGRPVPVTMRARPKAGLASLFVRDDRGCLIRRDPSVWSLRAPACLGCGTTKERHEAHGRCRKCYLKWRRKTDATWREAQNRRQKELSLTSDRQERYDAARKDDPKRKESRRRISRRWADRHSKWPIGTLIWLPIGNVCFGKEPSLERKPAEARPYLSGRIERKTNASAYVRFETFALWVPFARLIRQPSEALDA